AVMAHGHAVPGDIGRPAPAQRGCGDLMAVAEDIGPYVDRFTRDPFDREPATVDVRVDVLDDEMTGDNILYARRFRPSRTRLTYGTVDVLKHVSGETLMV